MKANAGNKLYMYVSQIMGTVFCLVLTLKFDLKQNAGYQQFPPFLFATDKGLNNILFWRNGVQCEILN